MSPRNCAMRGWDTAGHACSLGLWTPRSQLESQLAPHACASLEPAAVPSSPEAPPAGPARSPCPTVRSHAGASCSHSAPLQARAAGSRAAGLSGVSGGPAGSCNHDTDRSFAQTYRWRPETLDFCGLGLVHSPSASPAPPFRTSVEGTCGGGAVISEEGSDKVTAGSKSSVNTTSLADWPSLLLFDPGDGCRAGRLRFHRRGFGVSGRLLDLSRVCSGGGTPPTSHQPQGRGRCFILSGEPRPPQRAPGFGRGRLLLRAAREIFIFQGIWEFQPRVFRCLSLLPPSFLFPLSSPSSPIPSRPPLF